MADATKLSMDQLKETAKAIRRLIIKITTEGKYPFVEMGKSADLKKGQWCVAIGHPSGFRRSRGAVAPRISKSPLWTISAYRVSVAGPIRAV